MNWKALSLMENPSFVAETDDATAPAYRNKWNLATDTNLHAGVIYMASLNPKEPACFVMLGIAALQGRGFERDLHLAIAAFEKAIGLGSMQEALLHAHIAQIKSHIGMGAPKGPITAALVVIVSVVGAIILLWKLGKASPRN